MLKRFLFCFAVLVSQTSYSWFDEGHEVVGEIAWRSLDDQTKTKLSELLKQVEPIYPEAKTLATASKLADHMRSGFKVFDSWHYVTLPIMAVPGTPPPNKEPNAIWALCECTRTIATPTPITARPSFIKWTPNSFERGFMITWLAHLVGDMHQPLHSVSRYTPMLPDGDSGGNLFPVRMGSRVTNLHMLWDSGLEYFSRLDAKFEPKTTKLAKTDEIAEKLMKEHPRSSFGDKVALVAFREWAQDGYELAKSVVYDLPEGTQPTKAYIERGQKIVKQQVALAGYRLAFLLTELLSDRGATLLATGCSF